MDPLERIIRPIVEGQIRGFIKEHPSILAGVNWYKPRKSTATTLVNSLAKRIVRDLLCPHTRARIESALLASRPGELNGSEVGKTSTRCRSCLWKCKLWMAAARLASSTERAALTGQGESHERR